MSDDSAMRVDLRQLRYFVAVAEELQFSRAARRLQVAQPTVSAAIRDLERELDVQLFQRSTRSVQLTSAGRQLLTEAQAALATVDGSLAAARARAEEPPVLRVGHAPAARFGMIDALLDAFARRHPAQDITLREQASGGLLAGLTRYDLDVCITCCEPPGPSLESVRLVEEPLLVALPADHPLAGDPALDLRRLAELPLVLCRSGDAVGLNEFTIAACRAGGLEPTTCRPRS